MSPGVIPETCAFCGQLMVEEQHLHADGVVRGTPITPYRAIGPDGTVVTRIDTAPDLSGQDLPLQQLKFDGFACDWPGCEVDALWLCQDIDGNGFRSCGYHLSDVLLDRGGESGLTYSVRRVTVDDNPRRI